MSTYNNVYNNVAQKEDIDAKKVCEIDAALTICNKTAEENYCIIKEINDYLFGNPHPEAKEGILSEAESAGTGWFDKVLLRINDLRCKNNGIQSQLKKLHKEVVS